MAMSASDLRLMLLLPAYEEGILQAAASRSLCGWKTWDCEPYNGRRVFISDI